MHQITYSQLIAAFKKIGIDFLCAVDPNNENILNTSYTLVDPHKWGKDVRKRFGPTPQVQGNSVQELIEKLMPILSEKEKGISIYVSGRKSQDLPINHRFVWDETKKEFIALQPYEVDLREEQ